MYELINTLEKQGHDVTVALYMFRDYGDDIIALHKERFDKLLIIDRKGFQFERKTTYRIDDWCPDWLKFEIADYCALENIDAVICVYVFFSSIFEALPDGVVKIIDAQDKFTGRNEMLIKNNAQSLWFSTTSDEEAKGFNRADKIIAIQENEAEFYKSISTSEVVLMRHFESKKYTDRSYPSLKNIGIVASDNAINTASVNTFIDLLDEYIQKSGADITLNLAGDICLSAKTRSFIKKHGFLDSLDDFYNSMDLIVNPLTFGTGLKIKTVEALSYGLPLISTIVGSEGIDTECSYHLAEDIRQTVGYIDQCLTNGGLLDSLAEESRKIFDIYCTETDEEMKKFF
jgi:glycosyltransferase involved in cell wall biosynthesis